MYRDVVDGKVRCRDCKEWFEIKTFPTNLQKDGKRRLGSYCLACRRARGRKDMAKLRYGLTKEDFAALTERYPVCAICNSSQVFIDHNHETGEVRGRLCRSCNTGLGMFKEDEKLLDSAKRYLTYFRTNATLEL